MNATTTKTCAITFKKFDAVSARAIQDAGGIVALLDLSGAAALGDVRVEELLHCRPDHALQAVEIAAQLERSGAVDAIWIC